MTGKNSSLSGGGDSKKRQKKEIYSDLAKRFGVDPRTIERAAAKGAPVEDVQAMDAWFAEQKQAPGGSRIASLSDAKLEKLRLECHRLKIKIDEDLKALLPRDQMRRDHVKIMAAMRAEFLRFVGDIPNWSGMPPAEIKKRLDGKVDQLFDDLKTAFDDLGK
jgi:hypothetical protein